MHSVSASHRTPAYPVLPLSLWQRDALPGPARAGSGFFFWG